MTVMALQPWQGDPESPVHGWQVARSGRFGGGEGSLQRFQWPVAFGGDASQDEGLARELARQRHLQEQRVARVIDADGVIDRHNDLVMNPIAGGGVGGRDRVEMAHIVSQDVPAGVQVVRPGAKSRQPRRFNVR